MDSERRSKFSGPLYIDSQGRPTRNRPSGSQKSPESRRNPLREPGNPISFQISEKGIQALTNAIKIMLRE